LQALQEATIQRAKAEAEGQARLAEIAARQEHERKLHALSQDKHKKRIQMIAVALGVFFFVGAIGAGVVIKQVWDKANAAEARARQLEADKQEVEQQQARLKKELDETKDPEKIAALQQQLDATQRKLDTIQSQANEVRRNPGAPIAAQPKGPAKPTDKPSNKPPCNCTPGDPLCSCL
ncbi:MAG TPA: hypothetical protein VE987_22160, partial [Polyangiaceae bacterium]|nr:hypothetical protein [Polyangiaceae bacterium]